MKKILSILMSFCTLFGFGNTNTKAVIGNCNILILGKKGVGKSVLMHRILTRNFDRPIQDEEIHDENGDRYVPEKVYYDPLDTSISVVEADIDRTADLKYYCQNAHVIVHMSDLSGDNSMIPTTEEIRDWYTQFVRNVLDQDNLYGEQGRGRELANDPNFVARKINDGNWASDWWNLVEQQFGTRKMGYIFFVFNKLDKSDRSIDPDRPYDDFVEQRSYISKMDNARSILFMNLKDSGGDIYDARIKKLCSMCTFPVFRQQMLQRKIITSGNSFASNIDNDTEEFKENPVQSDEGKKKQPMETPQEQRLILTRPTEATPLNDEHQNQQVPHSYNPLSWAIEYLRSCLPW